MLIKEFHLSEPSNREAPIFPFQGGLRIALDFFCPQFALVSAGIIFNTRALIARKGAEGE